MPFDALLLVSFGGPEGPDEVMPFLRKVTRGRSIPPERIQRVAEQYYRFGGVSPINDDNRRLLASLRPALEATGRDLPLYWGNINWHPFLTETLARMRDDGVHRAAAFVTSAYSSYSSCRRYLEDIEDARRSLGPKAPQVVKLRPFFDHPGFVGPLRDGLGEALNLVDGPDSGPDAPTVLMTAHSIPMAMAAACDYQRQLAEVARRVAPVKGPPWRLVFQSRSGPPDQVWLGPDINDAIRSLPAGASTVIVVPIGFVSDHMEVVHDLDLVAAETARQRGVRFVRTPTPGKDSRFAAMVVDLMEECESSSDPGSPRRRCLAGCCPPQLDPAAGLTAKLQPGEPRVGPWEQIG